MSRCLREFWVAIVTMSALFGTPCAAERTFVFVHGAWVGEWYWDPIVEMLDKAGHPSIAVSLSGHGTKGSLNGPEIGIEDHANDIISAVQEHELSDIVLVAHSYGGRPAIKAWDSLRDQVSSVVFFEAIAPIPQSELAVRASSRALAFLVMSKPDIADSGMYPVPSYLPEDVRRGSMPQSLKSLYGEVRLENGVLPSSPKRTYVYATESKAPAFRNTAIALAESGLWEVRAISGGHNVVRDATPEMTEILLEIASN